jgi:hypothetical protein
VPVDHQIGVSVGLGDVVDGQLADSREAHAEQHDERAGGAHIRRKVAVVQAASKLLAPLIVGGDRCRWLPERPTWDGEAPAESLAVGPDEEGRMS